MLGKLYERLLYKDLEDFMESERMFINEKVCFSQVILAPIKSTVSQIKYTRASQDSAPNRPQCSYSTWRKLSIREIEAEVPQGSVFSLILYFLYTNDIPQHPKVELALFANDRAL
ncbi:hypothetical protein EVAR_86777_1 [Eumeta japonica]|uniref:Reverse transcriptase domain-containing protein n=1 Tax=Eumeta variegata TaxID=151549 RepID=A0A4C1W0G2_EUMVA|nr:hypothetical protein EVAR_86777_1 [Eumeta japonica]